MLAIRESIESVRSWVCAGVVVCACLTRAKFSVAQPSAYRNELTYRLNAARYHLPVERVGGLDRAVGGRAASAEGGSPGTAAA